MKKILFLGLLTTALFSCKKSLTDAPDSTTDPLYTEPKADGTCPAGYHWEFISRSIGYQCTRNQ